MSSRDSKYDVFRVRPARGKDRDKDSDKRSSIHGTGGIVVKKHRESTTSRSIAPSDSASQICDETQSQETNDTFSPDSTASSPLLRTSSAISLPSRTSPSSIQTPAALQPYLETEIDDLAITAAQESSEDNEGPDRGPHGHPKEAHIATEGLEDSMTPKPKRRAQSDNKKKEPNQKPSGSPDGLYENPFLPPQTAHTLFSHNFSSGPLPPPTPHHSNSMPAQQYRQNYPRPPPSPAQTWHDAPSQRSSSVVSANRSVTSDPSSTTTYIGQPQHNVFQPQENPMMLLQRVSSALPDIYMLMQHFHESHATLGMRENHIRQLEAQKEADAKRQDKHIDKLTNEIEAMLTKHSTKVDRLETKISKLEESKAGLQRSLAKETQAKEDARANVETLRAEQRQLAMKYLGEKEETEESYSKEKSRLISDHASSQRALSDHAQAQARIAETNMTARLGELNRLHEHERKILDQRRTQERNELQEGHTKLRKDLEDALASKVKTIEEERRDWARMRQAWEKEKDELSHRRDEERALHRKELEHQHHELARRHQKEKDETMKSMEASRASHLAKSQTVIREQESALESHSRQAAEAQIMISKLQREAELHKRHTTDAQEGFRKLQKENTEMRTALEAAQSRHQQHVELLQQQQQQQGQDRTQQIHSSNDIQNRSRTPSRQRSDPQETIKLRRDLENERGRNEDAQDTINKLRRELDGLRSHGNINAEKKHVQNNQSSSTSPTSQKASPEAKSSLHKTTSNESRVPSQK